MNSLERRVEKIEEAWGLTPDQVAQNEALLQGLERARERVRAADLEVPPPLTYPPEAVRWGLVERLNFAREEAKRRFLNA